MHSFNETVRGYLKPVLSFLDDPAVTEVMINGPAEVWVERAGKLYLTPATFTEEGLSAAAKNIAQFVGRVLSDERPRLDARLPDGSRIHVILPPVSRKGTCIAIRKFFPRSLAMEDLIGFGTLTHEMASFLDRAVRAKITCIVAGGTSSGKTTLLNILARSIPDNERIVTIEDAAELRIDKPHVVPLETRPPDLQGKGAIAIRDLLHSSLRLRPDRIIIGEVRGPEAFDLVQALNTGHGGSMCTAHASTPIGTLRRIESLCLMSEVDLPLTAVRSQVASAIDLVVCCGRLLDGSRRITHIAEVMPLDEKGDYRVQDLYLHTIFGRASNGAISGAFASTQVEPVFAARLKSVEILATTPEEAQIVEEPSTGIHPGDWPNPGHPAAARAQPQASQGPHPEASRPSQPAAPASQAKPVHEKHPEGEPARPSQGPRATPPEAGVQFAKPQPHMMAVARARPAPAAPTPRPQTEEVLADGISDVLALIDAAEPLEPGGAQADPPERTAVTRKPPPPKPRH